MRIGLLEDDEHLAELMQLWMMEAGFDCQIFHSGKNFIRAISRDTFDMLIIDWCLPDMEGDEVLIWVRNNIDWAIPVVFVTQRDTEQDIVHVLELGADDFMSKPVRKAELIARLRALYRRTNSSRENKEGLFDIPPYQINQPMRTISRDGREIDLTQKEFELACFLFRNLGHVVSRNHIMESVWGQGEALNTRTVDTHISRIRTKLELTPENGWRLSAIYQHGYRLEQLEHQVLEVG